MPTNTDKQNAINAALDFVHTDEENLIKQVAGEHALVNMGMSLNDYVTSYMKPERLLYDCFCAFYQQSESDEMAQGTMDEYKSWVKTAKRDIKLVKKAKLPLTVRNVRDAFLKKGHFAK